VTDDERDPIVCDWRDDPERHRWAVDFQSGDTCQCGRFYLHVGKISDGPAYELEETPGIDNGVLDE
jgi:hypothetical protein